MFTIVGDDVGRHDFLLTPCSRETFKIIYGNDRDHPSCFGNFSTHLARFGIKPDEIPTTFNIFMNVEISAEGTLAILPRVRKPATACEATQMDLIVGLTACSAEMSNNYSFKPISYEILP